MILKVLMKTCTLRALNSPLLRYDVAKFCKSLRVAVALQLMLKLLCVYLICFYDCCLFQARLERKLKKNICSLEDILFNELDRKQPFFLCFSQRFFHIITSSSVFISSGTSSKKTFFSRPPFFQVASIGVLKTYFLSCFSATSLEKISTLYFIFNKITGINICSYVHCINARVYVSIVFSSKYIFMVLYSTL